MKPEKMKVAVLAGGISRERDVSLRSGAGVAKALRSVGVKVFEVDVKEKRLKVPQGTDICFLCLHGTYGEDGEVQAELEAVQMPFTGSGSVASALAFDKLKARNVLVAARYAFPVVHSLVRFLFAKQAAFAIEDLPCAGAFACHIMACLA